MENLEFENGINYQFKKEILEKINLLSETIDFLYKEEDPTIKKGMLDYAFFLSLDIKNLTYKINE